MPKSPGSRCPDCKQLHVGTGRCPECERQHDKARGTRQQRGYDAKHDAERRAWAPRVALGLVQCWRCRRLIQDGSLWDAGHCDDDRSRYHGPEHMRCNRATSGRTRCPHPSHNH